MLYFIHSHYQFLKIINYMNLILKSLTLRGYGTPHDTHFIKKKKKNHRKLWLLGIVKFIFFVRKSY